MALKKGPIKQCLTADFHGFPQVCEGLFLHLRHPELRGGSQQRATAWQFSGPKHRACSKANHQ